MSKATGTTKLKSARLASVGGKLAGSTIAVIFVVTVGVYLKLSQYQRENLLAAKEVSALAVTRLFADQSAAAVVFDDEAAVKEELATLGRNPEVAYAAVWSVDPLGKPARQLGELRRGKGEVVTGVPATMRLRRDPDRIVVVSPVQDQRGTLVAVAVATFSLDRENRAIASIERTTLIVSSSVGMVFMILLMAMARLVVVRPLGKLLFAAKELEHGGNGDVDIHTNDEVGQLAQAFRSMAAAIGVREMRINARNRDMQLVMDNVGQGFITLDVEGTMSPERSRVIDEWFGPVVGSPTFWDYLRRIDPSAAEWFDLGWASLRDDFLPMSLSLQQLPALIRKDQRTFELAYRPVMEQTADRLDKVIVVITDVTARIEREHAEQAQREMMSIFRRTISDRTALEAFLVETGTLVDAITRSEGSDLTLLRQQVHTVKGNAALFGIESVAALCDGLEDRMSESAEPLSAQDKETLRAMWAKVRRMRAQLTDEASVGAVQLDRHEYDAFVEDLRRRLAHDQLSATAASWQFEPASKRLAFVAEQIQSLAKRLNRTGVRVVCQPTSVRLPPLKWGPFWSVFAHIVRNAVDHGIEAGEVRAAAGKPSEASVTLSVVREGEHVVVEIADDGPGIDWIRIAARARKAGLPYATRSDLERALLSDGISSRSEVTSTSGRGVGLSAVRDVVRELGGVIEIASNTGGGTTFRFILPVSMLSDDRASGQAGPPDVERSPATSLQTDPLRSRVHPAVAS